MNKVRNKLEAEVESLPLQAHFSIGKCSAPQPRIFTVKYARAGADEKQLIVVDRRIGFAALVLVMICARPLLGSSGQYATTSGFNAAIIGVILIPCALCAMWR